jgi:hypothetical protein
MWPHGVTWTKIRGLKLLPLLPKDDCLNSPDEMALYVLYVPQDPRTPGPQDPSYQLIEACFKHKGPPMQVGHISGCSESECSESECCDHIPRQDRACRYRPSSCLGCVCYVSRSLVGGSVEGLHSTS